MADEEKKERKSRVTRFGKERFPDEPVEYRPLVRKGGRKQGKADASQSRVPVKSSVSNPFEEKSKGSAGKRIKKTEAEDPQNTYREVVLRRVRRTISPEAAPETPVPKTPVTEPETSREFSWDDFEDLLSLPSKDPGQKRVSREDSGDVLRHTEDTAAEKEGYPNILRSSENITERSVTADVDPMEYTPFNRRKKAIACGVPPRFFYAMSKDGFLDGEITEESVKAALDVFYRKRVQERISSSDLTARELDIITEEIENIRQGHPRFFKASDFREDMSPDELYRAVIDSVRLKIRR